MRVIKIIALGLIALPLAEIVAFLLVVHVTGFAWAIVLLALVSVAGVVVLRGTGKGSRTRLRTTAGSVNVSNINLDGPGIAAGLGGILLLIPGFITGFLGAMTIFPLTRRWLIAGFRRLLSTPAKTSHHGLAVIDLEPDEWRHLPSPEASPRKKKRL
jgi:UPF0716 protein FxsA